MPSLFFTNTLMLLGMAALSIPIIVHLLLKRKKKRIQFSTVRFFLQQDEQSSRRRKLRNFLLLSMRLLIIALLVLAFSRPFSRQQAAAAAGNKQRRIVFVLDHSLSMLATGTEGQRLALAKERIHQVLTGLSADDSAAVVDCATHASVLSGFVPATALWPIVRDLPASYGTSSLSDGLKEAVRLLADAGTSVNSTIYIVSDLQKSACRGLSACPLPQRIELKVLPTGDLFSPNLAITAMNTGSSSDNRPQATITSFSDERAASASLELAIDGARVSSQSFELTPGSVTNLPLIVPVLKPGWHDLRASFKAKDGLDIDNTRYDCLWVPQPANVLVVEPRNTGHSFDQATFFLTSALDPGKGSTNSVAGAFNLTQVAPEQLQAQLTSSRPEGSWNVVVLPALKDLPVGIGQPLRAFVQGGGGLVLFLGQEMSANRYNGELADLLPARIGNAEPSPDADLPWRMALYDTNCLAFASFRSPNSGDLHIPQFMQRCALDVAEGAARLAFLEDGVPLVVTRTTGKGRVVLVNTTADTAWTDWQKHKTFVPFIHGLTKYAAQASRQDSTAEQQSFVCGQDVDLETGPQGRSSHFTLKSPDGKVTQLTADDHGRVRDPLMTLPGIYSLLDNKGQEVRRFAVNVPAEEVNLEAVRPPDFEQQIVRAQDNSKQTLAAGLFGAHSDQREFWTALLLGALVLLLVEPFVANRTSV